MNVSVVESMPVRPSPTSRVAQVFKDRVAQVFRPGGVEHKLKQISQPESLEASDMKSLRKAADTLVGSVFYGTLLRQMRSSVLQGPYGHGGRGEQVFAGQLDHLLAERAGSARSSRLSDAIVKRFGNKAEQMAQFDALRRGMASRTAEQTADAGRQAGGAL